MKLLKSKAGFTLIELLVVIGVLAVLAAIAIPSVAGLIDRANVSADKTNANEMTNAIERFAAEYELYCQDIASGLIDEHTTDFDAAQGRVFNVTGIRTRGDVTAFESETGLNGKGINRDTKYPVNEATLKSIVENYTKTSSATFTPKQSDHEFYYSPEVGVVIAGEQGATIDQLNNLAFANEDDIEQFATINWICLDETPNNFVEESNQGNIPNEEPQPPVIKKMRIEGTYYEYEDGMTWGAWVESKYNTLNASVSHLGILIGEEKISLACCFVKTRVSSLEEVTEDTITYSTREAMYADDKIAPIEYDLVDMYDGGKMAAIASTPINMAKNKGYVFYDNEVIFFNA